MRDDDVRDRNCPNKTYKKYEREKAKILEDPNTTTCITKQTSMSTLILWNITKAYEKNPYIDLKSAIKSVQERLERDSHSANAIDSLYPEERNLACALLAWQQLGHKDADSLYRFVEANGKEEENDSYQKSSYEDIDFATKSTSSTSNKQSKYTKEVKSSNVDTCSLIGPVIKLPVDTKIVMRLENAPSARQSTKKSQKGQDKDIKNKIDEVCCLESGCIERLAAVDAATTELRMRAGKLARREAERVELLERAEAAWKDLELGYQRRLTLAEEKEEDLSRQIQKLIEERNAYKSASTSLAQQLKEKSDRAETERTRLTKVEKELCDRACARLRTTEEAARIDATLAEHQCRASQLDRDLQFKEEQARRKLLSMENEADSTRALTHEAERAMRAELSALRDQIAQISNQLLQEDNDNKSIKEELNALREEKMGMIEDLEGCKVMCDNRMQNKVDELKKKTEQYAQLKDKLIECRCKIPLDAAIEAKRTPSLAALCRCTPEEKILESCSCTSLRSSLLSNLLADLFGGLQAELGGTVSEMPCQLLKCLEDKHNWDRSSAVKSNLRNFFSKLLVGELDIAIATSIENYHAKWVGASCADAARMIPERGEDENEGWEQRAVERRAQKLATKLAEQLFQDRADELARRAKDIVCSGPPPCECKPQSVLYSCVMKSVESGIGTSHNSSNQPYWRKTLQDVTQLRVQIEDLKKDSIKKEDLKVMEQKITKIIQKSSSPENTNIVCYNSGNRCSEESKRKRHRSINTEEMSNLQQNKTTPMKKKPLDLNYYQKKKTKSLLNSNGIIDKQTKNLYKNIGQSYAVNLCLCGSQKKPSKLQYQGQHLKDAPQDNEYNTPWKQKPLKNTRLQTSSIKQSKPITQLPSQEEKKSKNSKTQTSCRSNCVCFHKIPSNSSINNLLVTLAKYKIGMTYSKEQLEKEFYKTHLGGMATPNDILEDINSSNMKQTHGNNSKLLEINSFTDMNSNNKSNMLNKHIQESKTADCTRELPANTESEYMGAVNLDKTNDYYCNCIKNEDIKNQDQNVDNPNFLLKCINSSNCYCKKSLISKKKSLTSITKVEIEPIDNTRVSNEISNTLPKRLSTNQFGIDALNSEHGDKNSPQRSNVHHVVSTPKPNQCDCDYFVKFLGVTLTNTNSKSDIKFNNNSNQGFQLDNKQFDVPHKESPRRSRKQSQVADDLNKNDNIGEKKSLICNQLTKCVCNINFNEFKKNIDVTLNKQHKDNKLNHDKALDVQSFKNNVLDTEKSCVCCYTLNIDESNNLEVNTFHLLEEHLKQKLEEFKSSSCKSSCIPRDEEEKIFSSIFDKVKQIISSSTNQITCKCSDEERSEGSWHRAYSLLQEYLKTKIKRVQCLCASSDENKNFVLPDVLEKVCNLIENDFQRLKNICTCPKTENIEVANLHNKTEFELPIKDTNNTESKIKHDLVKIPYLITNTNNRDVTNQMSEQNSVRFINITQNISSQVPPNLGMENKSCDAMEKYTKNVQTSEAEKKLSRGCCNVGICRSYHCTRNNTSRLELFQNNEILVNQCANLVSNSNVCDVPTDHKTLCHQILNETTSIPSNDLLSAQEECKIINQDDEKYKRGPTLSTTTNNHTIEHVVDSALLTTPYMGYTINCSCDTNLGICVCTKSLIQTNINKSNKVWNTYINNKAYLQNMSYIMDHVRKENISENMPFGTNGDSLQQAIINGCKIYDESMMNKEIETYDEEEFALKKSKFNFDKTYNTANTSIHADVKCNIETPLNYYDCRNESQQSDDNNTENFIDSLYFPLEDPLQCSHVNKTFDNNDLIKLSLSQSCDCNMVPICHVKMLMDNIENKLIHEKCTCDSLSYKVCPLHATKNVL